VLLALIVDESLTPMQLCDANHNIVQNLPLECVSFLSFGSYVNILVVVVVVVVVVMVRLPAFNLYISSFAEVDALI
jgi:hypothetical protein